MAGFHYSPPGKSLGFAGDAMPERAEEFAPAPGDRKVRVTLDMSPDLYDRLSEIAGARSATKADILRRALALYDIALQAQQHNDGTLVIRERDGAETPIINL